MSYDHRVAPAPTRSRRRQHPPVTSRHLLVIIANRETGEQRALLVVREHERLTTEPNEAEIAVAAADVNDFLGVDWFVQNVQPAAI
ncbi:hypothetical protein [Nocardia suismassiliense]|uniref:hypothetical protein n=1 Tax=Nocardia suismassiliense TaxID=2077092 RepID=UPI00131F440F|nr:hypothetical protein [Nocardia suismassiliense]